MALVAGKCPNCGGDIQLDDSKEKGFCMHCGSQILVKDASKSIKVDSSDQAVNLTRLGFRKYGEESTEEAEELFKQAQMLDCDCKAAFCGEKIIQQEKIDKDIILQLANDKTYAEETGCKRALGDYLIILAEYAKAETYQEDSEVVKRLLAISKDTKLSKGYDPQTLIAYCLSAELTKLLIEYGADVNARDSRGNTLLFSCDDSRVAESLILNGADVNARNSAGFTALQVCEDARVLEVLIKHGADINEKDKDGNTRLARLAADTGIPKRHIIEALIKNGADLNSKNNNGDTPLLLGIKEHYAGYEREAAYMLIESGADVNAKNNDGDTALMKIVSYDEDEANRILPDTKGLELLLKHGADVNAKNNNGETALMVGLKNSSSYWKDIYIKTLIEHGADVNTKNNNGDTPLHFSKLPQWTKAMIDKGADVNAKNNEGKRPMDTNFLYKSRDTLRDNGGKYGSEKEGCYIATAVYGSYDAPEVMVLRRFRDEVPSKSAVGRIFIKTYYTISPPIARKLRNAKRINGWVKAVLDRLVENMNK